SGAPPRVDAVGDRQPADVLLRADAHRRAARGEEARDARAVCAAHLARRLVDDEAAEGERRAGEALRVDRAVDGVEGASVEAAQLRRRLAERIDPGVDAAVVLVDRRLEHGGLDLQGPRELVDALGFARVEPQVEQRRTTLEPLRPAGL